MTDDHDDRNDFEFDDGEKIPGGTEYHEIELPGMHEPAVFEGPVNQPLLAEVSKHDAMILTEQYDDMRRLDGLADHEELPDDRTFVESTTLVPLVDDDDLPKTMKEEADEFVEAVRGLLMILLAWPLALVNAIALRLSRLARRLDR